MKRKEIAVEFVHHGTFHGSLKNQSCFPPDFRLIKLNFQLIKVYSLPAKVQLQTSMNNEAVIGLDNTGLHTVYLGWQTQWILIK